MLGGGAREFVPVVWRKVWSGLHGLGAFLYTLFSSALERVERWCRRATEEPEREELLEEEFFDPPEEEPSSEEEPPLEEEAMLILSSYSQ